LLGAHPRIASPPETFFLFRVYHLRDYWGDLNVDARLRRVVHEMLNPMIPLFAEAGFDEEHLFDQLRTSDRSYRTIFDGMMRDFSARHGKERWSEKTPGQGATEIWDLFPEAQVVHIIRDARDVVLSSQQMPWELDDAVRIARRYVRFTLENVAAGAARGPAHYLRIRYEDLCRDPQTTMRLVCSFLEEDYDPVILDDVSNREATLPLSTTPPWQRRALHRVGPSRAPDHRRGLGAADRALVEAVVTPVLTPYGYPPSTAAVRRVGKALNLASGPLRRATAYRAAAKGRRSTSTPEDRYAAAQAFQRQQARLARGAWSRAPEPAERL
jgi:hypothetical protein